MELCQTPLISPRRWSFLESLRGTSCSRRWRLCHLSLGASPDASSLIAIPSMQVHREHPAQHDEANPARCDQGPGGCPRPMSGDVSQEILLFLAQRRAAPRRTAPVSVCRDVCLPVLPPERGRERERERERVCAPVVRWMSCINDQKRQVTLHSKSRHDKEKSFHHGACGSSSVDNGIDFRGP